MGACGCVQQQPENDYNTEKQTKEGPSSPLLNSHEPKAGALDEQKSESPKEEANLTPPAPEEKIECFERLLSCGPYPSTEPTRDSSILTSIENVRFGIKDLINKYEPNIPDDKIIQLINKWKCHENALYLELEKSYHDNSSSHEREKILQVRILKNDYIIGKQIGSGGFGKVRIGERLLDNQEFALKIVRKIKLNEKELKKLYSEIECLRIVRKNNIDNVVQLYDVYESDTQLVMVMGLIKGSEVLEGIVKQGPYTEQDAARIFAQLINALKNLHEIGIVHRDIKPENLMFENEDGKKLVLVDFGLAESTLNGPLNEFCGMPIYIAPEMYRKKEYCQYGVSVDLWSAGCILYILLSGRPPFDWNEKKDLYQLARDIKKRKLSFEYFDGISDSAVDLIKKLLEVDPNKRLNAKQCLEHEWLKNDSEQVINDEARNNLRRLVIIRKMKRAVNVILALQRCADTLESVQKLQVLETRQSTILDNIADLHTQLDLLEDSKSYIVKYEDSKGTKEEEKKEEIEDDKKALLPLEDGQEEAVINDENEE